MEPNLLLMLTHFRLGNEVIRNAASCGLKYCQLAGLVREDLERLGIEDKTIQDDLLSEFATLEGQDPNFAT